jgi:hypothetical protein
MVGLYWIGYQRELGGTWIRKVSLVAWISVWLGILAVDCLLAVRRPRAVHRVDDMLYVEGVSLAAGPPVLRCPLVHGTILVLRRERGFTTMALHRRSGRPEWVWRRLSCSGQRMDSSV